MKRTFKTAVLTLTLVAAMGISASAAHAGIVTASRLNVRSGPSTEYTALSLIDRGSSVTILGEEDGFYQISYNGKTAYVSKEYVVSSDGSSENSTSSGIVTASKLNVRTAPSLSSEVLSLLNRGTGVTILSSDSGFYQIAYGSGSAYVSMDYISISNGTVTNLTDPEASTGTITASALNVRRSPVIGSILTVVPKNTQVTLLEKDSNTGWYQIQYGSVTGWCSPDYIRLNISNDTSNDNNSPSLGERIVTEARKYLGYPYTYGGSSPSTGFDCSGLTSYVFSRCGISISRRASTQYLNGTPISKSALQPGDLVFFRNSSSGSNIGHVGIYIGNGEYIHAQSTGHPVCIASLSDSWSTRYYYGACRITG